MNKNQLKAKLFEKLGNNELQLTINELRKVFIENSDDYDRLILLNHELNILKQEAKKNAANGKLNKTAKNDIRNDLHEMINSIEADDVMRYIFEDQYRKNLNHQKIGGKGFFAPVLSALKQLTLIILLIIAFIADGEELVTDHIQSDECEEKLTAINNDVKESIKNADLKSVFKKLNDDISKDSKLANQFVILESRYKQNEIDYSRNSIISNLDRTQENNNIKNAILSMLDDLNCSDLTPLAEADSNKYDITIF